MLGGWAICEDRVLRTILYLGSNQIGQQVIERERSQHFKILTLSPIRPMAGVLLVLSREGSRACANMLNQTSTHPTQVKVH